MENEDDQIQVDLSQSTVGGYTIFDCITCKELKLKTVDGDSIVQLLCKYRNEALTQADSVGNTFAMPELTTDLANLKPTFNTDYFKLLSNNADRSHLIKELTRYIFDYIIRYPGKTIDIDISSLGYSIDDVIVQLCTKTICIKTKDNPVWVHMRCFSEEES